MNTFDISNNKKYFFVIWVNPFNAIKQLQFHRPASQRYYFI